MRLIEHIVLPILMTLMLVVIVGAFSLIGILIYDRIFDVTCLPVPRKAIL